MSRSSVQQRSDESPGLGVMEDITEEAEGTPSRRPRRSVAPAPGSLAMTKKRRRSSAQPELPDLREERDGEREDEVFGDENDEELVSGPCQLGEEGDALGRQVFGSFGFRTPKKGAAGMREKVAESMCRTPLSLRNTPTHRNTPGSAEKSFSTPTKAGCSTPTRSILKTPSSGRKRRQEVPDTPASTRKRVKKTLIRIAEEVDTQEYSRGSDTEEEEEECSEDEEGPPVLRGPPATPRTPARKGRPGVRARELNTTSMAEGYFTAHSAKVLTSDRTLSKLNTPRLSATEVTALLGNSGLQYGAEIRELMADHAVHFPKWLSLLHRGFNIVTYGLGSKKSLLHDFHEKFLLKHDTVVVNGFFPSLTIKSVLNHISEDILEMDNTSAAPADHCAEVLAAMDDEVEHLYLLVHNIDGVTLRSDKCQDVLAALAGHPKIHLVCSIDHINAPLIWDQRRLSKLNFIWFDCTTFLPYSEETGGESSLMTRQSGGLQLASLASVWASLTPNAKKVFLTIVHYQMENTESSVQDYSGISFMELYRLCRAEFLVASDLALRAQLTEFRDHKLVLSKRGAVDGGEYLTIPLDRGTMTAFLETVKET